MMGDVGREMYFIIDGECEVLVKGQQVAILGVGDFFGEAALLMDQVRWLGHSTCNPAWDYRDMATGLLTNLLRSW